MRLPNIASWRLRNGYPDIHSPLLLQVVKDTIVQNRLFAVHLIKHPKRIRTLLAATSDV